MNIATVMQQAKQMQEQMQKRMAEMRVEASAGGGMVTVRMSGHKALLAVTIDPEVMDPADPAMLQDLLLAAVNEATRKVDEAMQSKLGSFSGGLPGMM